MTKQTLSLRDGHSAAWSSLMRGVASKVVLDKAARYSVAMYERSVIATCWHMRTEMWIKIRCAVEKIKGPKHQYQRCDCMGLVR